VVWSPASTRSQPSAWWAKSHFAPENHLFAATALIWRPSNHILAPIHLEGLAQADLSNGTVTASELNRMFLKQIESRPPEGMMKIAFKKLRDAGSDVPEIMHLFRFKKASTDHLVRFTDEVMCGPSPLSRGMRELIGTYVSAKNQCSFCSSAHAPVAARFLGKELVEEVLTDLETSRLDEAHKELFRYVTKLTLNPASVIQEDVLKLKAHGWSEEAIYDALTVASLFKFYNSRKHGASVDDMESQDYLHSGERLVNMGYCMDFNLVSVLRVIWVGRKEIRIHDLKALVKIILHKLARLVIPRSLKASTPKPELAGGAEVDSAPIS